MWCMYRYILRKELYSASAWMMELLCKMTLLCICNFTWRKLLSWMACIQKVCIDQSFYFPLPSCTITLRTVIMCTWFWRCVTMGRWAATWRRGNNRLQRRRVSSSHYCTTGFNVKNLFCVYVRFKINTVFSVFMLVFVCVINSEALHASDRKRNAVPPHSWDHAQGSDLI